MNELILLRAVPGAGKSTVAKLFTDADHFEADMFWYDDDGNYNFDIAKIHEAHKWCQTKCEESLIKGNRVVISNTSTTEKEVNTYKTLAEKYNYRFISLIVENRHGGKNIHNVPDETLSKMEMKLKGSIKLK